ncbi:Guanine deaminase [Serratia rubidaea]|nr:Guanine deaminase [Serratia rubidaea]
MSMSFTHAIRGNFFDIAACVEQPEQLGAQLRHLPDGLLLLNQGRIVWFGEWQQGAALLPAGTAVTDYRDKLVVPGFVDCHIHYPQTEMIGAYGDQLLGWLQRYTFPVEGRFGDAEHAENISAFFLQQLLSNGTTTALVFATVHPQSVDALFTQAAALNMRLIAGKVMMDRHAPEALLETPAQSYQQTRALIRRWHGKQRLGYALTPRFAPTSSPQLLEQVQRLRQEFPDVWLHTHLSENRDEVAWVKELFPQQRNYLDVYHQYGLTGEKSVFAHCLHLEDAEWQCLCDTRSSIAFCPTSNLFLGSGCLSCSRPGGGRSGWASAATSGPAPPLICCRRWGKPTKWRSYRITNWRPAKPSITPRWAARARWRWTAISATLTSVKRRILWCSIRRSRRCNSCATPTAARWMKCCLC